jgi:hypothetical protein
MHESFFPLRQVPRHVSPDSLVIKQTLDATQCRDGNVAIPQLSLRKAEDILFGDGTHAAFNLSGRHAAASSDKLAANVFGNGSGTI